MARIRRSGIGRTMLAVRDNEQAAAALGLSPTRTKLTAFGISGVPGRPRRRPVRRAARLLRARPGFLVDRLAERRRHRGRRGPGVDHRRRPGRTAHRRASPPSSPTTPRSRCSPAASASSSCSSTCPAAWSRSCTASGTSSSAGWPPGGPSPTRAPKVGSRPGRRAAGPPRAPRRPTPPWSSRRPGCASARGWWSTTSTCTWRRGEVVGLIGANGAGKSTLMNAIGGFVPSDGRIEVLGTDVTGRRAAPARRARGSAGRSRAPSCSATSPCGRRWPTALETRGHAGLLSVGLGLPKARRLDRAVRAQADEILDLPRPRAVRRALHQRALDRAPGASSSWGA